MANKYVVNGATDLSLAASWDGGVLPSAGDTGWVQQGSQTITTGLTAVALNRFVVTKHFKGRIGTASAPVSMRVDNGTAPKWEIEGGVYHNIAAHTTGGVATLIINTPGLTVYLGGSGTFTTSIGKAGDIEIGANCVVTNIIGTGAFFNIYYNATAITLLVLAAGKITTRRNFTTGTFDGPSRALLLDDVACTTANIHGSAILNQQSTGTLGTVNIHGAGTYTPAGSEVDCTVTTANLYTMAGKYVSKSGQINAVPGTFNDYAGAGQTTDASGVFHGVEP